MNLEAIFNSFNDMKVAIVGDVMIDSYVMGKVHRMSPEAPVPVLLLDKEEHRLGGAANVVRSIETVSIIEPPVINGGMAASTSVRPHKQPIPSGPSILWPLQAMKSTPSSATLTGICGTL